MGRDKGHVGGHSKDVPQTPCLKEVERDVDVGIEQGLERDEPLLNFLCAVPVCVGGATDRGPAFEELLHGVHGLFDGIVGGVNDVVKEELGDKAQQLWEQHRRDCGRRGRVVGHRRRKQRRV